MITMDSLKKSLQATSIDDSEDTDGSASTSVMAANVINPEILMAIAERKSETNYNSDSDNEAEDVEDTVSQDPSSKKKASSTDKVKNAERERKLGRRAYKSKDYEKAVNHFQKAIDLSSNEVAYPFRLAEAKFEQKKYEECVEICSMAIKVGKENKGNVKLVASTMVLRGRAQKEQGRYDKAKADVEKAHNFLTSIALVKLEKCRYYEAFDFFKEAFECDRIFSTETGQQSHPIFKINKGNKVVSQLTVIVGYLDQSMSEVLRNKKFIEIKCKGYDTFRKND